jgi:hypothetical protein
MNNDAHRFIDIWSNIRDGLKQLRASRKFAQENYDLLSIEGQQSEQGRRAKDGINEVDRVIAHLKKVIKETEP